MSGWMISSPRHAVKRVIDVAGALVLLAVTSPVVALAALAIRRRMGPPVFFQQVRVGLRTEPFTLLKLRTMRSPEDHGACPADDAARLTDLGRWLRATSLDEIPQLWNVLRGDMSLVGPRPLLPTYLARYSAAQIRRHEVRPGITGLAQVRGRNALSWEEKFALDVWYVDHWDLRLDLRILWQTLVSVLRREGIAAAGHVTMPEFLGAGHGRSHARRQASS